jgi:hypothetical protein
MNTYGEADGTVIDLERPMNAETAAQLRILSWVMGEQFDPTLDESRAQREIARLLRAPQRSMDLGDVS